MQTCQRSQIQFYMLQQHDTYQISAPNMNKINTFFSAISQQSHIYENKWPNYSNLAQNQILFYMYKHQQVTLSDHGTKYKENLKNHQEGIHEDGQMVQTHSYIPGFCYCEVGNNKGTKGAGKTNSR